MAAPDRLSSPRQIAADLRTSAAHWRRHGYVDQARPILRGANALDAVLTELDQARDRIVELEAMLHIERGS